MRSVTLHCPQWRCRLKQQMVTDQDEEEDKVRWRVEAEVRLATEDMRARLATEQQTQLQADPGAGESGGHGDARC